MLQQSIIQHMDTEDKGARPDALNPNNLIYMKKQQKRNRVPPLWNSEDYSRMAASLNTCKAVT